jgi:hypothetical protein
MKTHCISIRQNVLKTMMSFGLVLLFGFISNPMNAQSTERTVTGIVSCSEGPLPYAAIVLKGTRIGVPSDENGAFTFPQKLKENDVLIVSFMGFKNTEVTITGTTTVIKPFLEDIPLIIVAALKTRDATQSSGMHKD